jgi:hypothetical protein
LEIKETEKAQSIILELFQSKGAYKLNDENAQEGENIAVTVDPRDFVKYTNGSFIHNQSGLTWNK